MKKKILLIQTAFIGDVVLATPLIERLAAEMPDASLHFLLRKGNEGLLKGHPKIEKVLVWDKKKGKYAALAAMLGQIRAEKYDWVINCQRFGASGFLTALSAAHQTVGFQKNPFSRLFSFKIPHEIGNGTHETERNLRLLEPILGKSTSVYRPRLYPTPEDEKTVDTLVQNPRLVTISPTSVWFTKQWPLEKWAELLQLLPLDTDVFLLGGSGDFDACQILQKYAKNAQNVVNLAGKLSFLASAALMRRAAMNYTNDSAPMHFASAMNAPVTAVFCSTIPAFGFGPLSDNRHILQQPKPLNCRPCGLHGKKNCPKGHFDCSKFEAQVYL